jgi:hypothetical protein
MQWGSGGGNNLSLEVATNINPANAAVNISPTGTGTVTINPATASTMNNVAIGGTTALAGSFTTVTATTGNFVVGTSGQGIDFSATPGTGTSELLADYEEGIFTPTIIGTSTAGTASYAPQVGVYTKIGRAVSFSITIIWSDHTGTGNMRVSALPFAGNAAYNFPVALGYVDNISLTAGNILTGYLTETSIILQQTPSGGGANANVPIDVAGGLMLSGTYFV